MLKIGSYVSMSGKEMMLGSVKEALSYNSNTFMIYTGAPQNTRRKEIKDLKIDEAWQLMKEKGITDFVIHAPYIVNLGNTIKPETYSLAVEFLTEELRRTAACGCSTLILHPGSHVGEGVAAGIQSIARGLNQVLEDTENLPIQVNIALETMAGKGSEIGRSFEELAAIYDKVRFPERLRFCFDTCHVHDAGYDIVHDLDGVLEHFDKVLRLSQIAVFHINDSKNPCGAAKDRHANIGDGEIGFDALNRLVHHPAFESVPKILETPWIISDRDPSKKVPPYGEEIARFQKG